MWVLGLSVFEGEWQWTLYFSNEMKWSERELFHAWEGADYYDVSIINIFKEKKI